jgi:hypothetical protein
MRVLWLTLLLALSPAPVRAQAPAAPVVLTPDAEARWVAFDLTPGNQIRFQMSVNGRPASAVLDTGVSFTVASSEFARKAGLKLGAVGNAEAIGGRVAVTWASVSALAFGGLSRDGGRVAVTDLKAVATGGTTPVDMLVGADLLKHAALDIDYDARRFRLLPSGRMPFRGISVPLSLASTSGIYLSEVTIGARRLRPVIVDTGDGASVTVSPEAWAAARLPQARTTTALAYGLGGELITDLAVVPQLRLATLAARNVEVRIEQNDAFSKLTGTAGRIGSGLLLRYRVLLDPRAGRMILTPGRLVDTPPLKSTSGLLVALDPRALRVLHVMRGSPAERDGWRPGDRICAIDGQRVDPSYAGSTLGAWTAGTPGRVVQLDMCEGDDRQLTLANFY